MASNLTSVFTMLLCFIVSFLNSGVGQLNIQSENKFISANNTNAIISGTTVTAIGLLRKNANFETFAISAFSPLSLDSIGKSRKS